MKIEPDKYIYPVKGTIGTLLGIEVDMGDERKPSQTYHVVTVSAGGIRKMIEGATGQIRGIPQYCGPIGQKQIGIWPSPEQPCNLYVRYLPPEEEE